MAPPSRRPPAYGHDPLAANAFSAVLSPALHGTFDAVLSEPIPEELLMAGGEGTARWDAQRHESGTRRADHG